MPKSKITRHEQKGSRGGRLQPAGSGEIAGVKEAPCMCKDLDHGSQDEAGRIPDSCELEEVLKGLFHQQKLAVLGTYGPSGPWGSLVAFASTDDLRVLIFVTGRCTRKYANLKSNSHVVLVVDNRSNDVKDFEEAVAVTVAGTASEPTEADRKRLLTVYLSKHPHLQDFAKSPSSALFRVDVEKFSTVYRFQNVVDMVPV